MTFANSLGKLSKADLAQAARVVDTSCGNSMQQLLNDKAVPRVVKDAIQAMHGASAMGVAYMETFGPPLVFLTPNVADTQHPLLLVVQGETVDLGAVTEDMEQDMEQVLPKYRDMLRRIAQDPVAQTVQFEFLMRLFFQHVLNVRPETLQCRRGGGRATAREWCSDGAAASTTGAGMLGPVLAFRGEIEAQGRGSLHPHEADEDVPMGTGGEGDSASVELSQAICCGVSEAFCDGINSARMHGAVVSVNPPWGDCVVRSIERLTHEREERQAQRAKEEEDKLEKATGSTVTTPATDPDRRKPRCTAAQYSSLLAESRIAHLEGLAV
eukprot:s4911_g5.t1